MHLHQPLYQRQTNSQPALRSLQRTIDLSKHLEDPGQHLGGDPHAAVPNPHGHSIVWRWADSQMRPPRTVYLAALFNRFENTCRMRVGSARSGIGSWGNSTVSSWPDCSMSGRLVSTALVGPSPARSAPTAIRSVPKLMREVEQVIDQADHLLHLPLNHGPAAINRRPVVSC